ncbi:MAG: DUF3754 domain-containing protein [Candidatus Omnitrophica bacterium]|nr:DUF3754 domain-containing protein [Candidatus Omnitrophota bacterium]
MTNRKQKQTFIPYRRADIIKMCLNDGKLDEDGRQKFRTFCDILTAYYHFSFHAILERLKDHFSRIDPDSPFKSYDASRQEITEEDTKAFFEDFENLLKKANFRPLSESELQQAFQDQSLIHLNTGVDFDDFEQYLFYYRGTKTTKTKIKQYRMIEKELEFETLSRVILVTKFKDHEYFQAKVKKKQKLQFAPGRTYMYYFKNVPKADLEIIFPNVKISMTLKDKLLFMIPLFGVGISTLFKMYGNLLILIGLILLALGLTSYLDMLGINPDTIPNQLLSLIAVIASITIVLGGFATKQYLNYKNKWIEFLNDVTQNLFFRSISINSGVFQSLIDVAEEAECKEAILAYYHLLTSGLNLNKEDLDLYIETWFQEKFDDDVDFDVEDALDKLECLRDTIPIDSQRPDLKEEKCLLQRNPDGTLKVLPLDQTIWLLDSIWDNIFQYHSCEAFQL